MKWIYNEYEFENRVNNLAWTISGNYDENVSLSKLDYSSKDVALYFAIMEGARNKYIDWDIVKKYIYNRVKKGYDLSTILSLSQIVFNIIAENKIIEERPGVEDIKNRVYKDILSTFTKIYNNEVIDKVKYAIVLESMGKHPRMDGNTVRIIKDIKEIDIKQDIVDILIDIDKIYFKYFQSIFVDSSTIDNVREITIDIVIVLRIVCKFYLQIILIF